MASRAISGRPGGGKSLFSVMLLVRELFETQRPIVTNLPLRLDNILRYCLNHGRNDIDVHGRIQILDDSEVPHFWRFRGNGRTPLPPCSNDQYKQGQRPAFDQVEPGGVCYFLDEVHDFLNSRNWQKTGEGCLFYISKHRHLGDDVFWITQAIKNVDSQFRSVTQDYTYCRNFSKEKYRGFTKGNFFTATTYLEPLTWQAMFHNPDYQEQEKFKLDPELKECYYTSKQKLAADTGHKTKGLSIKWLFAGIAGLVLLVGGLFLFGPRKLQEWWLNKTKVQAGQVQQKADEMRKGPAVAGSHPRPLASREGAPLETPDLNKDIFTLAVPLKTLTAAELVEKTGNPQGVTITPSPFGSSVILTGDNWQHLAALGDLIRSLDLESAPVVVIQAVVLRSNNGQSSNVGIWKKLQEVIAAGAFDLGNIGYDSLTGILTFGTISGAQDLVSLLGSNDVTRFGFTVESRPSISCVSGSEAWFTAGREVPLPVTTQGAVNAQSSVNYKKVLFSLGVRPVVFASGRIGLNITQTNDDIVGSADIGGDTVPTIATQSLSTRLDLVEGQVAMIGGIDVVTKNEKKTGFPILGEVPPLSWVWGHREKSEEKNSVLIVLTAYRVPASANPLPVKAAEPVKNKISQNEKTGAAVSAQVKKKERKK